MRRTNAEILMRENVSSAQSIGTQSALLDVLQYGKKNRYNTISYLLQREDANLYELDKNSDTLLHYCVSYLPNDQTGVAIIQLILEKSKAPTQNHWREKAIATLNEKRKESKKLEKKEEDDQVEEASHQSMLEDENHDEKTIESGGDEIGVEETDSHLMTDQPLIQYELVNIRNNNSLTPFHLAVIQEKWVLFEELLLDENALVNEVIHAQKKTTNDNTNALITKQWYEGMSLVHMLAYKGMKKMLLFVLESLNGDINAMTHNVEATPPLLMAIQQRHYNLVVELLKFPGVDPLVSDASGNNILHKLFQTNIISDPIQILSDIMEACPILNPNTPNKEGDTLLHLVAGKVKQTTCLRFLLARNNTMLEYENAIHNTPLGVAFLKHNESAILFLIDNGADFNKPIYNQTQNDAKITKLTMYDQAMIHSMESVLYVLLHHPNCDMQSAIRATIRNNQLDRAKHLLHSTKVNIDEEAIRLALLLIASSPKPSQQDQSSLLSLGKIIFPKIQVGEFVKTDENGNTLIHLALKLGHTSNIISLLLDVVAGRGTLHGMNSENDLRGSLQQPMRCGSLRKSMSIEKGMEIEGINDKEAQQRVLNVLLQPDPLGSTPLHTATKNRNLPVILQLLSYGMIGHRYDSNNVTPKSFSPDNVGLAFVNARDHSGATAFHYALDANSSGAYKDTKYVQLFCQYGADPTICNSNNVSVLHQIAEIPESCYPVMRDVVVAGNEKITILLEGLREEFRQKELKRAELKKEKFKQLVAKFEKFQKAKPKKNSKKVLDRIDDDFELQRQKAKEKLLEIEVALSCESRYAYEVYISDDGDIYDAMFHLTDLSYNVFGHNSYHSVQIVALTSEKQQERLKILHRTATAYTFADRMGLPKYRLLQEWGRLGDHYPKRKVQNYNNLALAIKNFHTIFLQKCGREFADRSTLEIKKGCYNFIFKYYPTKPNPSDVQLENELYQLSTKAPTTSSSSDSAAATYPLPVSTLLFLRLITNLSHLRRLLQLDGFDTEGCGMRSLSHSVIEKAYDLLRKIEELLNKLESITSVRGRRAAVLQAEKYKLNAQIKELSNHYYMTVPHHYGTIETGLAQIEPLNSKKSVQNELELLQSLKDVEQSLHFLLQISDNMDRISYLNTLYLNLGADITPLSKSSPRYELIEKYATTNSAANISQILKIKRWGERVRFEPFKKDRNTLKNGQRPSNLLLWHGTKLTNVFGILLHGLRIAPPDAPMTGAMFGRGTFISFCKVLSFEF
jgi:ankyrin repeat protein